MSEPIATAGSGGAAELLKEPNENSVILCGETPSTWAFILATKLDYLVNMAMEEKWKYDSTSLGKYPILRSYLRVTFTKLVSQGKVCVGVDKDGEEIAAFNTGLVDKKYDDIYAIFRKNTNEQATSYWFLTYFATTATYLGKDLIGASFSLPERADYFEGKIGNMLYDPKVGDLLPDTHHIICDRTGRLPLDLLKLKCGDSFLNINGIGIEDVYNRREENEERKSYFWALGRKIDDNVILYRELESSLKNAIDLALRRVQWNYKTAIPMYYPPERKGMLLLPLSFMDPERVDAALVVDRLTNAYRGRTTLTLSMAYNNSRLIAKPDSDWLTVENASMELHDDDDDDE